MKKLCNTFIACLLIGFCCYNCSYAATFAKSTTTSSAKICRLDLASVRSIKISRLAHVNIYLEAKKDYLTTAGVKTNFCHSRRIRFKHGALFIHGSAPDTVINIYVQDLDSLTLIDTQDVNIKALAPATVSINMQNAAYTTLNGNIYLPSLSVAGHSSLTTNIGTTNLRNLHNTGSGDIIINNLRTFKLTIDDEGSGETILRGSADANQITKTGKGYLNLRWLHSRCTRIDASGTGEICIAGTTKSLRATLHEYAFLNARYLTAKDLFVKTYDCSLAYVKPISQLFAYATGYGQINYYHEPRLLSKYTASSGVVLPMYR